MQLTGSQALIKALEMEGVDTIFGLPGGCILPVYDPLLDSSIRHILVRHEQGAGHMAEGYAHVTGRPGVAMVTSGPAATNIVTPLCDAYMDSIPMVVITGQVSTGAIGTDAFQECDTIGITRSVTKHNELVTSAQDIPRAVREAFHIATTGRPGPVLLDIPKDIVDAMNPASRMEWEWPDDASVREGLPGYRPTTKGHPRKIREAAEMILASTRPVIYAGGGILKARAAEALRELAELCDIHVVTTLMARGAFPDDHPLCLGMPGMHGNYTAVTSMQRSDLLIALGSRFDDRVTGNVEKFCPTAKIVHIDVDPASISKNVKVDVPIVGGVDNVLKQMTKLIKDGSDKPDAAALKEWWKQIDEWRAMDCLKFDRASDIIKPQYVVETLYKVTKGDAYVTSDVGQHQMWAAQFYKFDKPRRWINSGGLGTMGFGFPAAMGVQLAFPDETVCCVTGEGSIQMCIQELSTCRQYTLPIKIINLNNRYLGMVRQWQEFFYQKRYAMSYMESLPDFVKLAESYGHVGMRIEKPADVEGALKEAMKIRDKTVFLDFITDQNENVYPMIPAGAGQNEMILV